jgi:raffinose/stachyose/melibiose transport system permease protein
VPGHAGLGAQKKGKALMNFTSKKSRKHSRYPFYFVLGALILYLVFAVIPSIAGIFYSFTDWSGYSTQINFIGFDNFKTIFSPDENYLLFIKNTLVFTLFTIVLKTAIGLALALVLTEGVKRFAYFYRMLIYLPVVLPALAVALIFRSILNPATGLLNTTLQGIGLGTLAQKWLVNPQIALYSVIGVDTWQGVGYIMVILIAGLQSIPREYYEAAEVDGVGFWSKLIWITLPLMMPAIIIVTVLNLLYALRVFDIVYALTNGGPGYATDVIYTAVFKAFSQGQWGLGTAFSSLLFVFMCVLGYFVIRLMDRGQAIE